MDKVLLTTFEATARISLTTEQVDKARRLVNEYYLGDPECNVIEPSLYIVSKYPDKETPAFKDAHHKLNMCHEVQVILGLYSDGSITPV